MIANSVELFAVKPNWKKVNIFYQRTSAFYLLKFAQTV